MKALADEAGQDDKPFQAGDVRVLTDEQRALVARHMGLVGLHLKRHVPRGRGPSRHREHDDLFQEGFLALIRAATTYTPTAHGESFAAYALPRIRGAVHLALKEYFLTIRVPMRANRLAETRNPGSFVDRPVIAEGLTREVARNLPAHASGDEDEETISHAIRRRYLRAVRLALADAKDRDRKQPGASRIIERIAEERLLVPHPEAQTSLRRLARESGCYLSRIGAYESRLLGVVRQHFEADPQVGLLIRFAREDEQGFGGRLDAARRERLARTERIVFARRFRQLPRQAKAELIYRLLEQSKVPVTEVACNLHQLTCGPPPRALAKVA